MIRSLLLSVPILLAAMSPAGAHAFLEHSIPGAGAVVKASPRTLTLDFSEELEPEFSGASVIAAKGHAVEGSSTAVTGARMRVTLPALAPGVYIVRWHALSIDTHRTQGSFSFTVAP